MGKLQVFFVLLFVSFVLDLPTEHLHMVKRNSSEVYIAWFGTVGSYL